MKPIGFGKNYFSLSSILAYAVEQRLHGMATTFKKYLNIEKFSFSDENEDESVCNEELTLINCFVIKSKPCHCDCVFRKKARLAVALFKFIPRCPYYCKFFAFRRTGVHPPQTI
ncbi:MULTISPECIES: hypothetical protein [Malaciobacter]|jgi:hypothetical protein|uniref:Uncharacterized protein n=2 Tax=Malaciobacter TaxID=2321114 RepID=A0A1T5ACA5_9BACT|nr:MULTISPECIES: hypothetical protein [Malaciobacter]AXX87474.1 hypothetical protein AMRN_1746 [Malaciobacter marinus]PHO11156.1 hypothetical protein CPG37_01545 [Malaciobacter canalis]PHO13734.1 hypothetical protein CPG38_01720 [Malaciobacter marinus]PHO14440.1 hypothetical protein CPH92_11965 [Malaciobacter marinus]PPK60229.1 hypothetical protein B0F89_12615 [Malaciobacter marinus]